MPHFRLSMTAPQQLAIAQAIAQEQALGEFTLRLLRYTDRCRRENERRRFRAILRLRGSA